MNCPKCNSSDVAEIFWGYPGNLDSMKEGLDKKEIVLGGCLVSDHDPEFECNKCQNRWGDAEHNFSDKTDSFDYDQGFNLDEVYDQ